MFKSLNSQTWPHGLDLSTMRETLAYIESDTRRVPGLERATEALATAIRELESAERKLKPVAYSAPFARFLPRRH